MIADCEEAEEIRSIAANRWIRSHIHSLAQWWMIRGWLRKDWQRHVEVMSAREVEEWLTPDRLDLRRMCDRLAKCVGADPDTVQAYRVVDKVTISVDAGACPGFANWPAWQMLAIERKFRIECGERWNLDMRLDVKGLD